MVHKAPPATQLEHPTSYVCPRCDLICNQFQGIRIPFNEDKKNNVYCPRCFGKWIHDNISIMTHKPLAKEPTDVKNKKEG